VRASFPAAVVPRLVGTWPADDDNIFWVELDGVEVQIDSGDGGSVPFTVEGNAPGSRLDTSDVNAAAHQVMQLLSTGRP